MSIGINFPDDGSTSDFTINIGSSESWPLLDLITAIRNQGQIPEPEFTSPPTLPARTVDFSSIPIGLPAAPVRLGSGSSAVIENSGMTVVANYAQTACFIDEVFTEGRITFRVKRGPFIIGWHIDSNGNGWNIWSGVTGDKINVGYLLANGNGNQVNTPVNLPGVGTEEIYVSIETGPNAQGAEFKVWAWPVSGQKSQKPTLVGTYLADFTYGSYPLNSGKLRVCSYANTPVVIKSVEVLDGSNCPAFTQVAFNGRWVSRWEAGAPVMSTTRGGASFRLKATGAATLYATFQRSIFTTESPVLAVFLDGQFQRFVQITGTGEVELLTGLTPELVSKVEVFASGINQMDNKWRASCGVQLHSIRMISGSVEPWYDTRPKALWNGDSITEGSSAKIGQGSIPLNSCGESNFAVLASNQLGLSPVVNGFGGLGATVYGSGGWPTFGMSANYYMHDRPLSVSEEGVKYIFNSFGTNDGNASYNTMRAYLVAAVNDQKARYPNATIVLMAPSTGVHKAANLQASIETGVKFIDLSGVLLPSDTTDQAHPSQVSGHPKLANYITAQVNSWV